MSNPARITENNMDEVLKGSPVSDSPVFDDKSTRSDMLKYLKTLGHSGINFNRMKRDELLNAVYKAEKGELKTVGQKADEKRIKKEAFVAPSVLSNRFDFDWLRNDGIVKIRVLAPRRAARFIGALLEDKQKEYVIPLEFGENPKHSKKTITWQGIEFVYPKNTEVIIPQKFYVILKQGMNLNVSMDHLRVDADDAKERALS